MSGLIRRLYKYVKVDLSTLYLTYFSIFNRLEAFLYILTIWFLLDILLCKVRPKWVWHSTSLTTLVSRSRGGWSCLLRLREHTTMRDLTGFIVTNHLSVHSDILWFQGHFKPANNYQQYSVLHSGTIVYQENSIWRWSRLDLQRSVFRTMTYTIWALQIFYLMKRKRKEDLQVNLWDFSRQSDDMMSEFWFAFIKFSRQDDWIWAQRLAYF